MPLKQNIYSIETISDCVFMMKNTIFKSLTIKNIDIEHRERTKILNF